MDDGSRYKPLSVPRYSSLATFMRLPLVPDPSEVDIALIGVPFDVGAEGKQ